MAPLQRGFTPPFGTLFKERKMKFLIYKITNVKNNMIYIGCHKTYNINDSYMGSGVYLKRAILKYGVEHFNKEILFMYDNSKEMFQKENEMVNEEFVARKDTYNLKVGGSGGWDHINKTGNPFWGVQHMNFMYKKGHEARQNKLSELRKDETWSSKLKENISKAKLKFYELGGQPGFLGKSHSEETKKLISKNSSIYQTGEGNSQFGTMWIHNLELKLSKKIKKDELPDYEELGWLKGRKMKFVL